MNFVQKTSIVRRFQVLTVIFGFCLLLESAGTYFFSRSFLVDLRDLSNVNAITDFAARASDNISPARRTLEKFANENNAYPRQAVPVYEASEDQALAAVQSALALSSRAPKVTQLLSDAKNSLTEFDRHAKIIFNIVASNDPSAATQISKELLLVRQFELDALESLRGVQIQLNQSGNDIFNSVYAARFTPFLVSLLLALLFLGFELYFGFTTAKRLKGSLDNLLYATDQVARGNLAVKVPVLSTDEIGKFTSAFNAMVRNLEASMEDVRKAIQIRDEFLSIASHELKTPITSLKMQLQFARRQVKVDEHQAPTPEKLARVFDTSVAQVDRLTSLVEDLLDISRIESGKLSFNFERTDLCEIVRNVLERFSDALASARCEVKFENCDPIYAWCDPFRIEQVFVNLLSNAMKYSPAKLIEVSVTESSGLARLVVRDYGAGIPTEMHQLIFNRFERVSPDRNISGLGLGLYISKQMVEAHGGKIWVENANGGGSQFIVELPQTAQNAQSGLSP